MALTRCKYNSRFVCLRSGKRPSSPHALIELIDYHALKGGSADMQEMDAIDIRTKKADAQSTQARPTLKKSPSSMDFEEKGMADTGGEDGHGGGGEQDPTLTDAFVGK